MKKRAGIGVIEVIILVAASVVIVSLVVFAFINKNQANVVNTPAPASTIMPSQSATTITLPESTLAITQWGVEFIYANQPEGLSYTIESDGGMERVLFGSAELKKFADARDSTNWCDGGALGLLYRSTTNTSEGDAAMNMSGLVARVGGYYYMYTHTQNACSANIQVQEEQSRQQSQLISLLKFLR